MVQNMEKMLEFNQEFWVILIFFQIALMHFWVESREEYRKTLSYRLILMTAGKKKEVHGD